MKDQENTALWEKTCSKAHAAVALQSLCSCRCFGSRTSKFSIHCTVLKVGWRQKGESMLFQNRRERQHEAWGTHQNPPLLLLRSLSMFRVGQRKMKSRV